MIRRCVGRVSAT
ncbi:Protein of unknown function [Propionibacterium freudenreichii]|nr:Protein of unknown function [Propionibacterium freudenreichii]CEG91843.1 Protein of unknown function [Propionibacterium freudenreichii]CEG93813.1 Protein of unknown function [Propionibacterium freudenreichii]CEG98716.1 Protein of unknown function [Propionibacterium freudenreichii]CEG99813.1 Protein of unknown function [Propionibacterium freudenreichii]